VKSVNKLRPMPMAALKQKPAGEFEIFSMG
jgi:hypothetical protein